MVLQKPWVSKTFRQISRVSLSRLLIGYVRFAVSIFAEIRKFRGTDLFVVFIYKWRLNVLEPKIFEFAFKTLWSLGPAIEEVKMSQTLAKKNASLAFS